MSSDPPIINESTSVIQIDSGAAIVYVSTTTIPGQLVTVRDATGFTSTGSAILLSTVGDALIEDGTSTTQIQQRFGYVSLQSDPTGTLWSYTNANSFFDPADTAPLLAAATSSLEVTSAVHALQQVSTGRLETSALLATGSVDFDATLYPSSLYVNAYTEYLAAGTNPTAPDLTIAGSIRTYGSVAGDGAFSIQGAISTNGGVHVAGSLSSLTGGLRVGGDIVAYANMAAPLGELMTARSLSTLTTASLGAAVFVSSGITVGDSVYTPILSGAILGARNVATTSSLGIGDATISFQGDAGLESSDPISLPGLSTGFVNSSNAVQTSTIRFHAFTTPTLSSIAMTAAQITNSAGSFQMDQVAANTLQIGLLQNTAISLESSFQTQQITMNAADPVDTTTVVYATGTSTFSNAWNISSLSDNGSLTTSGAAPVRANFMATQYMTLNGLHSGSTAISTFGAESITVTSSFQIDGATAVFNGQRLNVTGGSLQGTTNLQASTIQSSNLVTEFINSTQPLDFSGRVRALNTASVSSVAVYAATTSSLTATAITFGASNQYSTINSSAIWTDICGVNPAAPLEPLNSRPFHYIDGLGTYFNKATFYAATAGTAVLTVYDPQEAGGQGRVSTTVSYISTQIGTGYYATGGDGGPLALASGTFAAVVSNADYGCYVTDVNGFVKIRRVDVNDRISSFSGNTPNFAGDGGPATQAAMSNYLSCSPVGSNVLMITDFTNQRLRRVTPASTITTYMGGTAPSGYGGDGGPVQNAVFASQGINGIGVDLSGNYYLPDLGNNVIRKVNPNTDIITLFAGTPLTSGFSGDGGPALSAEMTGPSHCIVDSENILYFIDIFNYRIRKIDLATNIIDTYAGSGNPVESGDGGPALSAGMTPTSLSLDSQDNLYFADFTAQTIRKINKQSGIITRFAGTGMFGYSGNGGPALAADLYGPASVAIDSFDNVYISEALAYTIRKIDALTNIITLYAGIPLSQGFVDNCPATTALFTNVNAAFIDKNTNRIYIGDNENKRVRVVDPNYYTPGPAPSTEIRILAAGAVANPPRRPFIYSYDGINFQLLSSADTQFETSALSIAWNGELFVAGSGDPETDNNKLAYSYDGKTWLKSANGTGLISLVVTNIAWAQGRFVGVCYNTAVSGYGNSIIYSDDGINWTGTNAGDIFSVLIIQVKSNEQYFLACGFFGTCIAMSTDRGVTWTPVLSDGNGMITLTTCLCWNGTKWLAGGYHTVGSTFPAVIESYDGINWTNEGGNITLVISESISDITWNGHYFIAVGSAGPGTTIAISEDGIFWTSVNTGSGVFSLGGQQSFYSEYFKRWYASGLYPAGRVATSTDGVNWATVTSAENLLTGIGDFAERPPPARYVAAGRGNPTLSYSYDGSTWEPARNWFDLFNLSATATATNGKIFVATGTDTRSAGGIAFSFDGVAWTRAEINSTFQNGLCIAYGGGRWLAGGPATNTNFLVRANSLGRKYSAGGNNANVVLTSGISALAYGAGRWVAGGGAILAYSDDEGISWSTSVAPIDECNGLAYNGSVFVMVGRHPSGQPRIFYSADGITWNNSNSVTSIFSSDVFSILWDGSIWIAAGTDNIATSSDGITWTAAANATSFLRNPRALATDRQGAVYAGGSVAAPRKAIAISNTGGTSWSSLYATASTSVSTLGLAIKASTVNYVATGTGPVYLINSFNSSNWYTDLAQNGFSNTFTNFGQAAYDGRQWVLTGSTINTNTNILFNSPNGSYWTPSSNGDTLGVQAADAVAVGLTRNDSYVSSPTSLWVTTVLGDPAKNHAWSTDGSNWTGATSAPFVTPTSVATNGYLWLSGGSNAGGTPVAASFNGDLWSTFGTATPPLLGGTNVTAVGANSNMWVIGTDSAPFLQYSYDTATWTPATVDAATFSAAVRDVAWNGKAWVATGAASGASNSGISYSYNGRNWSTAIISSVVGPAAGSYQGLTWDGQKWLVGFADNGGGTTRKSYFLQSLDSINWTPNDSISSFFSTTTRITSATPVLSTLYPTNPTEPWYIWPDQATLGFINPTRVQKNQNVEEYNGSFFSRYSTTTNLYVGFRHATDLDGGVIGFTSSPTFDVEITKGGVGIDSLYGAAFYFSTNNVYALEAGERTLLGPAVSTTDTFLLRLSPTTFRYYQNGELLRTVNNTPGSNFSVEGSMNMQYDSFEDVHHGPDLPTNYTLLYDPTKVDLPLANAPVKIENTTSYTGNFFTSDSYSSNVTFSFQRPDSNDSVVIGLTSTPVDDTNITKVNYGFFFNQSTVQWYEAGGTGQLWGHNWDYTDTFRLSYDNNTIRYFRNETMLRETNCQDGAPFSVYGSIYYQTTGISNLQVNRISTPTLTTNPYAYTVAGNGSPPYAGDGGPVSNAVYSGIATLAYDNFGNLIIPDYENHRIRQVDRTTSIIKTIVGTGIPGYTGNGGIATSANINYPYGIYIDPINSIYFSEIITNTVRRVDGLASTISLFAGIPDDPTFYGDNIPATATGVGTVLHIAADSQNNIYLACGTQKRIRKIDPFGTITTVVGTGTEGRGPFNVPAVSTSINAPVWIAFDSSDNMYITDAGNHDVYFVNAATQILTRLGGTGAAGFGGDGGPLSNAQFNGPGKSVLDASRNLLVLDYGNNRLRKTYPVGIVNNDKLLNYAITYANTDISSNTSQTFELKANGQTIATVPGDFRGTSTFIATDVNLNTYTFTGTNPVTGATTPYVRFDTTGDRGYGVAHGSIWFNAVPNQQQTTNKLDSNLELTMNRGSLSWPYSTFTTTIDNALNDASTRSVFYTGALNNASDPALKECVQGADTAACYSTLAALPLRRWAYCEPYLSTFQVSDAHRLGFLTTEIVPVFPKSVVPIPFEEQPWAPSTIQTLDTTQIRYLHLGATQHLAGLVSTLEEEVSTAAADLAALRALATQRTMVS